MRKRYSINKRFLSCDESGVFLRFALVLNCGSVCDYEKREECGPLTTRALRTVPSQAVKHILVLFSHTHKPSRTPCCFQTQQLSGCET